MHDVGGLDNTNELLGIDGVTGIKTGTLDDYGASLLFSTELSTRAAPCRSSARCSARGTTRVLANEVRALLAERP